MKPVTMSTPPAAQNGSGGAAAEPSKESHHWDQPPLNTGIPAPPEAEGRLEDPGSSCSSRDRWREEDVDMAR